MVHGGLSTSAILRFAATLLQLKEGAFGLIEVEKMKKPLRGLCNGEWPMPMPFFLNLLIVRDISHVCCFNVSDFIFYKFC